MERGTAFGPWVRGFAAAVVEDGGAECGVKVVPTGLEEELVSAVAAVREADLAVGSPLVAQKTFSKWWGLAIATETLAAVPKHQTDEHLLP